MEKLAQMEGTQQYQVSPQPYVMPINLTDLVCAGPHFESYVRKGVRSSNRDIHLFMAGFRPEESEAGRKARARYH